MYKVKRFSQMTEIQQRQYGLLGNIGSDIKRSGIKRSYKRYVGRARTNLAKSLRPKVDEAIKNRKSAERLSIGVGEDGYREVMNPKVSNKIIRNNAKRLDARVMKSNSSASSMRKSSEIDDQVLKSEGITNPRNVRKVMNATKENRHIVMLSPGYSKSTDTLAHELGHVQNANSKNPIVKVIHEVSGRNKRINPEDRGIGNIIKNSISHKLRINEEARASRNAMKMLKKAGATEDQLKQNERNLNLALNTYKTAAKEDRIKLIRNTIQIPSRVKKDAIKDQMKE